MNSLEVRAVVLAAGESSRMQFDKALLTINGKTVIQHLLFKLSEVTDRICIVLGSNYDSVVGSVPRKEFPAEVSYIFNENHHLGMFSSIQKAFSQMEMGNPVLLQMIDQPFLPLAIYKELISSYDGNTDVYQPSYNGRAGHPLLLSGEFAENVLSYKVTSTMKEIIAAFPHNRGFMEVDDSKVLQNINTPAEFEEAVKEIENGNDSS